MLPRNVLGREIKNSNQLNVVIDWWNALRACPVACGDCNEGSALARVPANVNYFSPFSSVDLWLQKTFAFRDRISLNLIGEGLNLLNEVNVRGTSNANFARRDISVSSASSL